VHEADKPDLISDFPYADILTSEDRAEVDLAVSDADSAALRNPYGPVVKRVVRDFRVMVFAG
jgi:hypothetical protein